MKFENRIAHFYPPPEANRNLGSARPDFVDGAHAACDLDSELLELLHAGQPKTQPASKLDVELERLIAAEDMILSEADLAGSPLDLSLAEREEMFFKVAENEAFCAGTGFDLLGESCPDDRQAMDLFLEADFDRDEIPVEFLKNINKFLEDSQKNPIEKRIVCKYVIDFLSQAGLIHDSEVEDFDLRAAVNELDVPDELRKFKNREDDSGNGFAAAA